MDHSLKDYTIRKQISTTISTPGSGAECGAQVLGGGRSLMLPQAQLLGPAHMRMHIYILVAQGKHV